MDRDDLLDRLKQLDDDAYIRFGNDKKFSIVIVGGGALVLLGLLPRATMDIDVIRYDTELVSLMAKRDINNFVSAYAMFYPYNLEDRLIKLEIGGKAITFYSASLEDLVIAKLFSPRPKDYKDISSPEVLKTLDWDKLKTIVDDPSELETNALSDRALSEFKASLIEYEKEYKCKN